VSSRACICIACFAVVFPPARLAAQPAPGYQAALDSVFDCAPLPGAEPLLRPGIVLLGEVHGTVEGPDAVSKLACLAVEAGLEVAVALEIPATEQDAVDRFLAEGDREGLLSGAFWMRDYQDGRSSAAMFELLSTLGKLRAAGAAVDVFFNDDPEADGGRDRFMAETLAERVATDPGRLFLALVGNQHSRVGQGTRFDPDHEPMGLLLRRRLPEKVIESLELTHGGGTAWVCTGPDTEDCGSRELSGRDGVPGIEMYDDEGPGPYTGRYYVERITASPPAFELVVR